VAGASGVRLGRCRFWGVDIELQPPAGFTGMVLGRSEEETVRAAERFGPVSVSRGALVQVAGEPFLIPTKMVAGGPEFNFALTFDESGNADTVEVWRPPDPGHDGTVTFEGLDVFRTPWSKLLAELESRGHRIVREDGDLFAYAPDLTLGFSRDAAHEVPEDADGLPLYFESVLVAAAGYYDEADETSEP